MPSLRAEGDQNRRERLKTTEAVPKLQYGPSKTRSYNDDSTPVTISYSGAPVGDLSYSWDANKNKTSESIGGIMSGYGFSAGYDAEDRVIRWDRSDTNLDQSWELSPVGDWNSITESAAVQHRTHGPVHELDCGWAVR